MRKALPVAIIVNLVFILVAFGCAGPSATPLPSPAPGPAPTSQPSPAPSPSPAATPKPAVTPAPATKMKPLEFKLVTYRASAPEEFMMAWDLVSKLEERSKGLLKFKHLGGAEVIPIMEQYEALKRGIVDIVWSSAPNGAAVVPEGTALNVVRMTPEEMRKSGLYDYLNDLHQKQNLYYVTILDPSNWYQTYQLFLNVKIEKPEDMKGLRIRTAPAFTPMLNYFGASTVSMPLTDVYTALERGLVVGTPTPATAVFDSALQEVLKYYVLPGFGKVPVLWLFNLNTWNSIPPEMQKLISDTAYELEKVWAPKFYESRSSWLPKLDAAKLTRIQLSPEAGQRLVDAYYDSQWKDIIGRSPVHGPKLRQLAGFPPLAK